MSTNISKLAKLAEARSMLKLSEKRLARFCHDHHIRRLALISHGQTGPTGWERPEFLVEFESTREVGYLELVGAELELSGTLRRKVELLTPGALPRGYRTKILIEAQNLYIAA
jgi:hypothetical protein